MLHPLRPRIQIFCVSSNEASERYLQEDVHTRRIEDPVDFPGSAAAFDGTHLQVRETSVANSIAAFDPAYSQAEAPFVPNNRAAFDQTFPQAGAPFIPNNRAAFDQAGP